MVRMHNAEMYLVSVTHAGHGHGDEVAMVLLTEDLVTALNTARAIEGTNFNMSGIDHGVCVWAFNVNVFDADRLPVVWRYKTYRADKDSEKVWIEEWMSEGHRLLAERKKG